MEHKGFIPMNIGDLWMRVNVDLHIHSRYSKAVSGEMNLQEIARKAFLKGIKIMGTGDCLFPKWMDEIQELPNIDGIFKLGETYFALSVEVEDSKRVHHLLIVPEISKAEELRVEFSSKSNSLDTDGRPKLNMTGAEIADAALEADCLIGPSHSFTPWTGIFAHYESLGECYQEKVNDIKFIELGLSADTDYADRIAELKNKTFLSNSDAHSPNSNKLAREFNQVKIRDLSFQELKNAICRKEGMQTVLNVGFFPEEGKYNRTACSRCYRHFTAKQMNEFLGRCPICNGLIKLGVRDRVDKLADYRIPVHPDHRPPYLHIIPLAEIISIALGVKSPYSAIVQKSWNELVSKRSEIKVLAEIDLSKLDANPKIIDTIEAFRSGRVEVIPGGGGKYGDISIHSPSLELPKQKINQRQKSLIDF
jgi:uncharacterized protein (TIGR00375 family)